MGFGDRIRANGKKHCVHFIGIQHATCKAGVNYRTLPEEGKGIGRFPCLNPHNAHLCPSHRMATPEEIEAEVAEVEQAMARLAQGLSSCCGAELDRSRLLTSGRHKGSGWLYCSKCKKPVVHLHA